MAKRTKDGWSVQWEPKRSPWLRPEDSHDAWCRASDVTIYDAAGAIIATVNAQTGERRATPQKQERHHARRARAS